MSALGKVSYKRFLLAIFNVNRKCYGTDSVSLSGILSSGLPDIEIPKCSLSDFIFENFHKWENRIASECAVTGRNYTFAQVRTKSKNFGDALRKKFNLEKENKIAILLPNIPEFNIVSLGALTAGLISTTINPLYTPDEISRQLIDSSAKVIITLNELWPLANAAAKLAKQNIPIITVNSQQGQSTPSGAANFAELTDTKLDLPQVDISVNDISFLPYSSGTTGLPKGVQLTHHNVISNICQLAHPDVLATREATSDHQDVISAVLPMFHIYGLVILSMFHMRIGAKIVTLPKFTPEFYINSLRNYRPNVLYVAPPIALFISNMPTITSEDLQSVRAIVNGAAPLGYLDTVKLEEKSKNNMMILQGYGLTETSPAVLSTRPRNHKLECSKGSIGLPVPNTKVKIINPEDPKGTPLGPNQYGELLVQGPQVMKGYYNRPEENIFLDGWLRTGDMMYYNEEGFFFITDRLKELIKVKGFQVAPAELEEIIRDFPDVVDAAVIGIPHESDGEAPRAYVVAKPNAKIDITKLQEHVKRQVAPYKQLKGGVALVEGIPKNASGKILRRQLKQQFEKERK